jgi:hypothetical protein
MSIWRAGGPPNKTLNSLISPLNPAKITAFFRMLCLQLSILGQGSAKFFRFAACLALLSTLTIVFKYIKHR